MATTARSVIRQEISKLDHSYDALTTTTKLTTDNAVIDTKLAGIGYHNADSLKDAWIWLNTALNASVERTISANTAAGTLTIRGAVLVAEAAAGTAVELHKRFRPSDIHNAIARACNEEYAHVFQQIENTTLHTYANQNVYPLPSGITDVYEVMLENRLSPNFDYNILYKEGHVPDFSAWTVSTYPDGSDAATNITLSQYTTGDQTTPFLIFGENWCKCVSTTSAGSHYWTTLATPANYGGIKTTYEEAIYCTTADEVKVTIVDSAGNTASSTHGGTGLELVRVSHTTTGAPTTLTAGITTVGTTAATFYRGRAIWTRAEHYVSSLYTPLTNWRLFGGNIEFLEHTPPAGRFLLLKGKAPLSALTTDTSTIEVGEPQVQIIYAGALLHLYRQLRQQHSHRDKNPYNEDVMYWERQLNNARMMYGIPSPPVRMPRQQP